MEEENHGRSYPGCMKGLVHFLNLHHLLHLRKMKMLTYRKHGEDKRAARNKEPKTDPDAPSTSQQYVCGEDTYFGVEDKTSTTKQPGKSSMRISIPKWKLREHNKKRKVSLSAPMLLRSSSIHHWNEDHVHNVNFGVETSVIKQNVDVSNDSSSNERVYVLSSSSFDEHNIEKQCDEIMVYSKNGSFGSTQPDELESILHVKQPYLSNILNEAEACSFAQKGTNEKELQGDTILHPSKEFIAMMKLFDGNIELIRNILVDPSFIFAHYLQAKQAFNAELTRAYSFPASWQLERKNDGQLRIKHTKFDCEALVDQSHKFHSENSRAHSDIIQDKERNPNSSVVAPSPLSILQNVWNNPSNSNRSMAIKHNQKEHHRIFMDGVLHKVPFGRRVMEAMKKSKSGWWDGSTMENPDWMYASWNKIDKNVKKGIQRTQSLNESLDKYSHLYESIPKVEFQRLPERMKAKSLGRILSLPDIKYCSSSKNAQSKKPISSPDNLTTSHIEEILEKEESKECTTEVSNCIALQGENILDEAHTYEPTKPSPVSATEALAPGGISLGFLDFDVSQGLEHTYPSEHSSLFDINAADGLETNEIDLAKADIDRFDYLHLQVDPKDEPKFNYVREILIRSGFSGSEFLKAWHSPHQPMDPLIFNETEALSYELEVAEDEHDILLEHQLLFDLINEALVETYENFLGCFFPWLSRFNTNSRPMPMGDHILEEIWANICWHLKGYPQRGMTLEDIVSRNYTKNDGWMNMQYDIEDVELELECLILDALLDEVVLQFSISPC